VRGAPDRGGLRATRGSRRACPVQSLVSVRRDRTPGVRSRRAVVSLDSFFDDRSREPQQTRAVLTLIAAPFTGGNLILVTHQVNITALTGIVPAMARWSS